jgi:hypothetical protein
MSDKLISEEIYPNIVVYKNTFKNVEKIYDILKESSKNNEDRLFGKWETWSIFGTYLSPPVLNRSKITLDDVKLLNAKTEIQKNQKDLLIELITNFELVTKDYSDRYNLGINLDSQCIGKDGISRNEWNVAGPSICKYHISYDETGGMRYHSDFIKDKYRQPRHEFAVTALAYFNDDYEGGEIDFAIGNKLFAYKPKAGDFLVFPSGHPEILTEDNQVYLHGVNSSKGTNKYFSRMYWQKWYDGSEEWFENENKFGKEEWKIKVEELEKEYRKKYPQRSVIENGVRIQ